MAPAKTETKESSAGLFIVDNSDSDWKVRSYLREWCELSKEIDIATGYFEIGSLLALDEKWQAVDHFRILMGDEVSMRTKRAFAEGLKKIAQRLDGSVEAEKAKDDFLAGVPSIVAAIKAKKIECRVYRKDKFHAKAYITHGRAAVVGSFGLVGSSNFTFPGLCENVELNVQVRGSEVGLLQEWYERHWEDAEDITPDILRTLERHTDPRYPFEIWFKSLHEFFSGHELTPDEWDTEESAVFRQLAKYQRDAYKNLVQIAHRYGGAFLCDGVGLGKTYVGLMLIERFVSKEKKNVVLFAPKAARQDVWEPVIEQLLPDLNSGFVSLLVRNHTDLQRKGNWPHAFEVKHARTGFVWESHHFKLLFKDNFRSRRGEDGRWDGVDNQLAWIGGQALVRSLRALLAGTSETKAAARSRQIRVQLPDIAILDAEQDDLFRQPYNVRLRISGAPGTGKTTVLLKRLSQKTKYEFLTEAETRAPLGQLADANQQVLLKGAELLAAAGNDIVALRAAQERFANFRNLNQSLNVVVSRVRAVGALQDADGTISLSFLHRKHRELLDLLPSITAERVEAALFPEIPRLVAALHQETREMAEAVSLRRLFEQLPRAYQDFREAPENQERYFATETEKLIREKQLTAPEQDTLLFHALEFYRTLHGDLPSDMNGVPGELRNLRDRMRMLVAVDEVTDFSALEIACMVRFATPRSGGVTICGDLLQRVTQQGLKRWDQLDELALGFTAAELSVSYRQTPRLFEIAKDLFSHATGEKPNFRSAHAPHDGDPAPLWFRPTEELPASAWLAERIVEICDLCEGRLPTTAILVPQAADVPELHSRLVELLQGHGIGVDASERGNALGDEERVRIFPVEFIKGLEFEVVFYVGLDRMADVHKELIEKYFYVGLSRARSFLGVTCERSAKQLPQSLQCIHPHFIERRSFAE